MSDLFLLGAGASHGSGNCFPSPPPLGNSALFDALVRMPDGVAGDLPLDLQVLFADSFEKGMVELLHRQHDEGIRLTRDIAEFIAPFMPANGNHLVSLIAMVKAAKRRTTFATTNYDIMLERAAGGLNYASRYSPDAPDDAISILKIHGSCNFLPNVEGRINITGTLRLIGLSGPLLEMHDTRIASTTEEIINFCRSQPNLAPCMAFYAPGKATAVNPSFVQQQQADFELEIDRAENIYIIGLAVVEHDEHIWGKLARARGRIWYISPDTYSFAMWAGKNKLSNAAVLYDGYFGDSLPTLAESLGVRAVSAS